MVQINWGFNCLTSGIHHGRPEIIWNLPLIQATRMFNDEELEDLVVTRIYKDAMQFVENAHPAHPITTSQWAEKTKALAEERLSAVLTQKLSEIEHYYTSATWHRDVEDAIKWFAEDKLNSNYQPLHGHDSINMLCRILGQSASLSAAS